MKTVNERKWHVSGLNNNNYPLVVNYKGNYQIIGAGTTDSLSLFTHEDYVVLLTLNRRIGYCGIDVYTQNFDQHIGDVFLQSEDDIHHLIGENWDNLADFTLARRLFSVYRELNS